MLLPLTNVPACGMSGRYSAEIGLIDRVVGAVGDNVAGEHGALVLLPVAGSRVVVAGS